MYWNQLCCTEFFLSSHLDALCTETDAQKEITSQTDLYLVNLSSKTYVFEDILTKY